jgi:hypothetical protein
METSNISKKKNLEIKNLKREPINQAPGCTRKEYDSEKKEEERLSSTQPVFHCYIHNSPHPLFHKGLSLSNCSPLF